MSQIVYGCVYYLATLLDVNSNLIELMAWHPIPSASRSNLQKCVGTFCTLQDRFSAELQTKFIIVPLGWSLSFQSQHLRYRHRRLSSHHQSFPASWQLHLQCPKYDFYSLEFSCFAWWILVADHLRQMNRLIKIHVFLSPYCLCFLWDLSLSWLTY